MTTPFRLNASLAHQQYGIAVVRVITGIVFCAHGIQKWGMGIPGVTGMFTAMGIPMAGLTGPLIATLELVGGVALIIGLLTRLAALGLAADMLGAIVMVHVSHGLLGKGGYELALSLLGASVGIVLAGPGALSVDSMIGRRDDVSPR